MDNKGQTTVLFTLIISVLFLFTLTALEVGRIHMSKVKINACVHSMCSGIMADYNSELFERYHLLFMDPTYGTGSEAVLEEKIIDFLETSLNGEDEAGNGIYQFTIEEIAVIEERNILEDDMKQVKEQIIEYEKTAGVLNRVKELAEKVKDTSSDIEHAVKETEANGVEMEWEDTSGAVKEQEKTTNSDTTGAEDIKVEDPRETLTRALKHGILSFLLPNSNFSTTSYDFSKAPSGRYQEQTDEEKDYSFQSIDFFKNFLKQSAQKESYSGLETQAAFVDYASQQFSNACSQKEDSVLKCETEYILMGKANDYDNLQAVVNEMTWMRMPMNYAYLLTDSEKKSEALTLAAGICTATGTEGLIEVVKYLLLGCWAYGESLYEMKLLLSGKKIAVVKTKENWNSDLKNLCTGSGTAEPVTGMDYEEYLMLLLAKKSGKKLNACYARMLDVMELNLQKENPDFSLSGCIGGMTIQGKVSVNAVFMKGKAGDAYDCYWEEVFCY